MFNSEQLKVIKYCAEECYRQGSDGLSVSCMVNAWAYAQSVYAQSQNISVPLSNTMIAFIGRLVEPIKNKDGFRKIPIYVGNRFELHEKAPWDRIPDMLTLLLESYYEGNLVKSVGFQPTMYSPVVRNAEDQFYYEFENIHPFKDGNGRVGKILYNYLKGTLDDPQMPPNFWEIDNP